MTNVGKIIARHRTQMEAAGLLRREVQLSSQVAAMRPSLTKVRFALRERPDRFAIDPSPLSIFFSQTLPQIEHILREMGDARAGQIIGRLCEYGKARLERPDHLEKLFKGLPLQAGILEESKGIEMIIEAYETADHLRTHLGNKIEKMEIDRQAKISLKLKAGADDKDLIHLRKAKRIKILDLSNTQITDAGLKCLRKLIGLQYLYLSGARITGSGKSKLLKKLPNLQIPDFPDQSIEYESSEKNDYVFTNFTKFQLLMQLAKASAATIGLAGCLGLATVGGGLTGYSVDNVFECFRSEYGCFSPRHHLTDLSAGITLLFWGIGLGIRAAKRLYILGTLDFNKYQNRFKDNYEAAIFPFISDRTVTWWVILTLRQKVFRVFNEISNVLLASSIFTQLVWAICAMK